MEISRTGTKTSTGGRGGDAEQRVPPSPFEDSVHDAEGRADRQQVHDRGDQRDEQAPEYCHEQQEPEQDDDGEEQDELGRQDVGEVGPDGGGAADQDGDAGAGLGFGDDVVAEPAEQRGGLH